MNFGASTVLMRGAREYQEDALLAHFPYGAGFGFAVLSDGMGGHAGGDVASKLVVSEVTRLLMEASGDLDYLEARIELALNLSVEVANKAIRDHVRALPEYAGMGATLVLALVIGTRLYWVSIGDSLLLLHRNGQMMRMNTEHPMAARAASMATAGAMDEARPHDDDSLALTSALTGGKVPRIDCRATPVELQPGDLLLAASDGLTCLDRSYVSETITRFRPTGAQGIAHALGRSIETLNEPRQDNLALAVIEALA